jgi:hypothetical protein
MSAKKKAKKKSPAKKKVAVNKGPRQTSLPGMEDRKITALDNAALSYDEIKKQRMALTEQEVEAKELVRSMMHKQGKTTYKHNGIQIDLVPEGEKVKVKIKPEGEEEDEPDTTDEPSPEQINEAAEDDELDREQEEESVGA